MRFRVLVLSLALALLAAPLAGEAQPGYVSGTIA